MLENELDKLPIDYREFTEAFTKSDSYSQRVLQPVIRISRGVNKYVGELGALTPGAGGGEFVSARSNHHNWVVVRNRIRPLPFDAPSILLACSDKFDFRELTYPQVLHLKKAGIDGFELFIEPDVFESANLSAFKRHPVDAIPGLNATLYPYQAHGVSWLVDALNRFGGAILADEMGLGKTLQIIAAIMLVPPGEEEPALVICPTSLIANWQREVFRFAPELNVLIHRGNGRTGYYRELLKADLIITTYDTLVNDISLFRGVDWSYVVCDEAQALKNPEAKRREAVSRLFRRFTIPVTGTPVENSLVDLWSLADISIPGILGDLSEFESEFPDSESSAEELSSLVDNFILKRKVSEVAQDLPKRSDIDIPVEMSEESWKRYNQIRQQAIDEYGQAGRLVAVGKLAMYCAHPWLSSSSLSEDGWDENAVLTETREDGLVTPKIEVCLRIMNESFVSGRKVLIFASFNSCYELIKRAAAEDNDKKAFWGLINGSTPAEDRQGIVDSFSEYDGPSVLVLNPRAAGAGLNITAATVVIHFTQNWNPALEMQASARAHRRGQELPVSVYRLFYADTVEETMIERSKWKRDMGDSAVPIKVRDDRDLAEALKGSS